MAIIVIPLIHIVTVVSVLINPTVSFAFSVLVTVYVALVYLAAIGYSKLGGLRIKG